jgi:exopolysaccharide biosynthesis polyprenyl glycosylphosphotransferase
MMREMTAFLRRVAIFSDALVIMASFIVSYFIRSYLQPLYPLGHYIHLIPLFTVIWLGMLHYLGLYGSFRMRRIREACFIILEGTLLAFIIFTHSLYIFKIENVSRSLILLAFIVGCVLLALKKIIVIWSFRYFRKKGMNSRRILLVGSGRRALEFLKTVEGHPEWGILIAGIIENEPHLVNKVIRGYKVIGTFKDIPRIIHNNVIDEVVCIVPATWMEYIQNVIHHCEIEGVAVNVAIDIYEPRISRMRVNDFFNLPILTFESAPDNVGQLVIKRLFDITVSSLALIFLTPIFLIVSVMIKWSSPGPVFYKQLRCGLNGRKFNLYKFRTMEVDAEKKLKKLLRLNEMKGPAFKIENDPRIIPVGHFLRKFSLDELPQFWNVLKGDMSLVGPRPPIPSEVDQYDDWHRRRLRMRPGITCLWQINGRNKITDFNEWANLDLQYMDNWSLGLDFEIFLKTIPVVLKGTGAK